MFWFIPIHNACFIIVQMLDRICSVWKTRLCPEVWFRDEIRDRDGSRMPLFTVPSHISLTGHWRWRSSHHVSQETRLLGLDWEAWVPLG